jgi:acyl carrier protein
MEKEEILQVVIETIDKFADYNGLEIDGAISPNQRLIGSGGLFDSMGLVNFIVDLEEVLEEKYDIGFSLQDERAMSRSHSPFLNPEELTKFIIELYEDQ